MRLFRWAEKSPEGKRSYRKRVISTVCQYSDADAARTAVTALLAEANSNGLRREPLPLTVTEVCNQFEQRELTKDNVSRIYSTKKVFLITRFVEIAKATVARLQESENVTVVQPGGSP